ncbi:ankyrin repeat-containing protein [Pochonia chlamydosporia 170]|uniref:Ankyrin repeat-containing protein n=1 Tax=Pochonia chlamydosporia 170 TaxID=1380566 RepID=A0A179G207_METCM|nr:ankyrin repeat-containing protein [Pochonia chlamydosporia 170]OAQ71914.1 ankyrin repeat-containing protein [Pochonia chlamydosporia 170]
MSYDDYTVAWICALPVERAAAEVLLDNVHGSLPPNNPGDDNNYTLGNVGNHNVAIVCLPSGVYGTNSAAKVVSQLLSTFRSIRFCLMVGIAGGVPSHENDIRLGDIVVSHPSANSSGVVPYDFGKVVRGCCLEPSGVLNKPPPVLLKGIATLRSKHMQGYSRITYYLSKMGDENRKFYSPGPGQDKLFQPNYDHTTAADTCTACDRSKLIVRTTRKTNEPLVHYGVIASGNQVMKHGVTRDRLARKHNVICFEMEAAGLMDSLPCLVIRGVSDYADSHKNKHWQGYAAAAAAAYAKELLSLIPEPQNVKETVDTSFLTKVLDALLLTKPEDDRDDLIDVKGRRVHGTCEWFIHNNHYSEWLQGPDSQILWVSGGPGKGKTMLAIYLTQVLEQIARTGGGTLLFYFCDGKNEKRNTAIAILRGLLYQLLQQRCYLLEFFRKGFTGPGGNEYTVSHMIPLWDIFVSILRDANLGSIFCVLDGLDECEEASLKQFLKKLSGFFSEPARPSIHTRFNLILLSRVRPKWIEGLLRDFPRVKLDPDSDEEVGRDVDKYISYKIEELSAENELPKDTLERVRKTLQDGAHGTFLWVGFVAEDLKGKSHSEVEYTLTAVPKDLSGLYRRMLYDIQDPQNVALIISWVVLSRRPLTLAELATAAKIEDTSTQSTEDILKFRLESCGMFLRVESKVVHLVHQSAKEYLQTDGPHDPAIEKLFITKDKHLILAKRCLECMEEAHNLSKLSGTVQSCPLWEYAALYWPEHLRLASDILPGIHDISESFFRDKSEVRSIWWSYYWASRRYGKVPESLTVLHLAAYFGITSLAAQIVQKRDNVRFRYPKNKKDTYGRTPLLWAADRGHVETIGLLLNNGASINAVDNRKMTALHLAIKGGHGGVIPFLIKNGARVNSKDDSGNTPLLLALRSGSKDITKLLLQSGVRSIQINRPQSILQSFPVYRAGRRQFEEEAENLIKLQVPLFSLAYNRQIRYYLPIIPALSIFLKLKPFRGVSERFLFHRLRSYEASESDMVFDIFIKQRNLEVLDHALRITWNHSKSCEVLMRIAWRYPLWEVCKSDKSFLGLLAQMISLGGSRAISMGFRDVVELMANHIIQGFRYGLKNGYLDIAQRMLQRVFADWRNLLMENKTSEASESVCSYFILHMAALAANDVPLARFFQGHWLDRVQELMCGKLKEPTLDCVREAEQGGDEFTNSWAVIVAGAFYEALSDADTLWVFTQISREEIRCQLDNLTGWQLQTILELLLRIKQSRRALPLHLSRFVPTVLAIAAQKGLSCDMNMTDFVVDPKA